MIVDENGREVIIRGMGLGGWMLQEPYMLKLSGSASAQYDIRNKITALIGETNTQNFYNAWLDNHCTRADIDSLAAWGFNSVRLPMHYNLFTLPVEKEPVRGKNTWLTKGFELTDSLLAWCKANHIYLILDLHATPGGQGNDNAISDRDASLPSLWQNRQKRDKTIALWKKLAARYANESWIGGYDIINEPNWGFTSETDRNGCAETVNTPLKLLLKDITRAIRQVDKKHIIYLEGNCWANNYEGMFPLWDHNMVISFHKYWNYTDDSSIRKFLDYRNKYNVPLWLGETGENSNDWFTKLVMLAETNKIGWAMWPLKKSGINNLLEIRINPGMQQLISYWEGKAVKPSSSDAYKALMDYASNSNIKNNIVHRDVIDALTRQTQTGDVLPYRDELIKDNTVLFAVDYDMGRAGSAYHDKDSAEYWVATNVRTDWNSGGMYRNDGVDIEACSDLLSNGYNVGWIQDGEWLQYSVFNEEDKTFDIQVRIASAVAAGELQLLINGKPVTENIMLPPTGGTQLWKTTTVKNVKFEKGWSRLRVLFIRGGFNLNYLQFTAAGDTEKNEP